MALQYYYRALMLVRTLQYTGEAKDAEGHVLVEWLPKCIDDVLEKVKVEYDKRDGDRVYMLFSYDGEPVSSIDFMYNDGRAECNGSAKDGQGMLEMAKDYQTDVYHLSIEYEYKDGEDGRPNQTVFMFQNKSLPFRLLLLSLLWALPLSAQQKQTFTVEFEPDTLDATAQNTKHQKRDGDGQRYAIIKVRSTSPDDDLKAYDFNFGYLKHEVKQHNESELWVYVQRNAKWVTISRQGYATMEKFDLRTTIEAGHTYRMLLSPTAAPVLTQMVMFSITPADAHAAVSVRSEKEGAEEDYWGSVDETGRIARALPLGTYTYKVMSQDFLPSEGRLLLNQANQTHEERVQLRPNFADITLRAADPNTEIYVNGHYSVYRFWRRTPYSSACRRSPT